LEHFQKLVEILGTLPEIVVFFLSFLYINVTFILFSRPQREENKTLHTANDYLDFSPLYASFEN